MDRQRQLYLNYSQAELDAQYDQRTLVPDLDPYLTYWREAGERARRTLDWVADVAYGPGSEDKLDVCVPRAGGRRPVMVFLHGGAWRMLRKEHGAFAAPAFMAAGALFVCVDFASAADTSLDAVVAQVRAALAWVHRHAGEYGGDAQQIYACGHSSGAHLVAMLLVEGWHRKFGVPEDVLKGAVLVSGVYDLEPVRLSARNAYLRLSRAAARRNSPIHYIPKNGPPIHVTWSAEELAEFRRQPRAFVEAWRARGNRATTDEVVGCNHFDMCNTLGDPTSPTVRAALEMMGLA